MLRKRIDFGLFAKQKPATAGGGMITGGLQDVMSTNDALKDVITMVQPDTDIMWASNGEWSMHELLMELLNITGPAQVYISSYALSETPARILAQLKDTGMIQKLYCVLDNRIDVRTAGTLQVMKSICDKLALIATHAKVTVVKNSQWNICVVGSANYTENKRWESGIISTKENTAAMQVKWIKQALKDGIEARIDA